MPTLLETQGRPCVAFLGENPSMICLIQWLIYEKKLEIMTQRDGMGREEGSGWGKCVYLWLIHFDIWQNQYNIVKLKNKKKKKEETKKEITIAHGHIFTKSQALSVELCSVFK